MKPDGGENTIIIYQPGTSSLDPLSNLNKK